MTYTGFNHCGVCNVSYPDGQRHYCVPPQNDDFAIELLKAQVATARREGYVEGVEAAAKVVENSMSWVLGGSVVPDRIRALTDAGGGER